MHNNHHTFVSFQAICMGALNTCTRRACRHSYESNVSHLNYLRQLLNIPGATVAAGRATALVNGDKLSSLHNDNGKSMAMVSG
jgi:hypothetical protein